MDEKTITAMGSPRVQGIDDFGTTLARVETRSVEGEELNLDLPLEAARKLTEDLRRFLQEME